MADSKDLGMTTQTRHRHLRDPLNNQFSRVTEETTKHELTQPAKAVEVVYTKNVHEADTWLKKKHHRLFGFSRWLRHRVEASVRTQQTWRHREQDCRYSTGS